MEEGNETLVTEFLLLGLSDSADLQNFLFVFFVLIYLANVVGNVTIMLVIRSEQPLHTPMYFFISILSFIDIFYSSTTMPKMFTNFLAMAQAISRQGCLAQMFFFHFLGSTEAMLLTLMGFDRYLAIFSPLRYPLLMTWPLCLALTGLIWSIGFFHSLLHVVMMSRMIFCRGRRVQHFFCDIAPLLKLACSDVHINELLLFAVTGFLVLGCFTLTFLSYVLIVSAVLRINSSEGRQKAFSTCAAHLTVVVIHYGCAGFLYLHLRSRHTLSQDRVVAVLYTAVTPLLNPLIYTLRNKEVKAAIKRAVERRLGSQGD
ncbi:olfactory receptor 12D1-like [Phascolarctos cinereus]|uniref:Olfactory receptor n=1 Tax=Phascolarctos cinereus TaxID=38626 RepID=A0A6P5JNS7_PHACI|nr:olfactory receptor 12D1-like [Phascolarctos cinereus]